LVFIGCPTPNDDDNNNLINDGYSLGYSLVFCDQETTILILDNSDSNNRAITNNAMTYRIEKRGKGVISSGSVSSTANKDSLSFVSNSGKKFKATLSKINNKNKLEFSSSLQTDVNTTETIGSIEEASIFITQDTTDFAYLLNVGGNAFEIGYQKDDGTITFLEIQSIRATSAEEFAQMLVSLGSHSYLFYECKFNNNDSVDVSLKKITKWVPPYTHITADTFMVASGQRQDDKGLLDGVITSNISYEETTTLSDIHRLSMDNTGFIYENTNNTEYPYLLWGGYGYFKLGRKNENGIISFLPIYVIGATSHDGQIIHQPEINKNIYIAFDFIDVQHKKVNVYISGIIPGSHHYINFESIKNELDTHILNDTALDHYSFYEYTFVENPGNWIEENY
jgi:hypothetical protein